MDDPWTAHEIDKANELLRDATTGIWAATTADPASSIYSVFGDTNLEFKDLSLTEICQEARIVQLAMMLARTPELTVLREAAHSQGKSCMEALVHTYDWTVEGGPIEEWYVKTAGDLLQCWWVHWLLLDSNYFFAYNHCQAAFARWLSLQRFLLGGDLWWEEHSQADLCEAATLYLPRHLAHKYLCVLANFHKLWAQGRIIPRCQHVGRVPCHKRALNNSHFCRRHQADAA